MNPERPYSVKEQNASEHIIHAVPTNQCNMLTVAACISILLRDSKFPKGHPIVKNCLTDSNMVEISDYLGFAQVRILPPSDLHLPLLPYKSKKSNKLTFPNCVKCADLLQTMLCNHSEKERPIVGVRKTIEINKALTLGYKILDFFQVWHYEDKCQYDPTTGQHTIFSEYVNMFYKLKTAADGFLSGLKTIDEKLDYIN